MPSALAQIGGFNEKEFLTTVDYAETPDSGQAGIRTSYDSSAYGAMREYRVKFALTCWKRDKDDVIAALPSKPTALSTNGGKNADGTAAARIQWGSGYELKTISPSTFAPSMSRLVATYHKIVAEAQEAFPSSVVVTCAAGVYTVAWNGDDVVVLDNGTGSCGTDGIEFVKLAQRIETFTVIRDVDGTLYTRVEDRYYNPLSLRADGVSLGTLSVLAKTIITSPEVSTSTGSAGETLDSTRFGGTSYAATLEWIEDGTASCKLMWCDYPAWSWET